MKPGTSYLNRIIAQKVSWQTISWVESFARFANFNTFSVESQIAYKKIRKSSPKSFLFFNFWLNLSIPKTLRKVVSTNSWNYQRKSLFNKVCTSNFFALHFFSCEVCDWLISRCCRGRSLSVTGLSSCPGEFYPSRYLSSCPREFYPSRYLTAGI